MDTTDNLFSEHVDTELPSNFRKLVRYSLKKHGVSNAYTHVEEQTVHIQCTGMEQHVGKVPT